MELLDEEEVAVGIQVANERGEEERASEWAWRGRGAGGGGWADPTDRMENGDVGFYGGAAVGAIGGQGGGDLWEWIL